ncbi:ATP-binding protein [Dendrosporobacter sp. 1207_IL3150]|uniref:ATP-binding protein n=1 Tax=Dendrosporobacter sp. 1207_IL3150 TaxID=3084054 RepID=UPI002FDA6FDB
MNQRTSLKNTIVFAFIMTFFLSLVVLGFIMFSSWHKSVNSLIIHMENDITKDIVTEIGALVAIPLAINRSNHRMLEHGIINIEDEKQRNAFFVSTLRETPNQVYSFAYGTASGDLYGARRNTEDDIEIIRSDIQTKGNLYCYTIKNHSAEGEVFADFGMYDPRTREWYKLAVNKGKPVISPIYQHFAIKDLAISVSCPVYNNEGILNGVLGTNFILSNINDYLSNVVANKSVTAFIVEKESGLLVANSLRKPNFTLLDNKVERISIDQLGIPYITNAYQIYKEDNKNQYIFETDNDRIRVKLTDFTREGLEWVIISATPESLFTVILETTFRYTAIISILLLSLAIALGAQRLDGLLKPLYSLIEATEKFRKGDFSHRAIISRNDEIGRLSSSFNNMADELQTLVSKLTKAINLNPNIIILLSLEDHTYIEVNDAFLRAAQVKREDVIGRNFEEFNLWADLNEYAYARSIREQQGKVSNFEMHFLSNGEIRDGLLSCEEDEFNGKNCLIVVITDITDKKKLDNELARLESLNLIGEMAASIGHEVRNPMTTVRGYLQLFQRNQKFELYKEQIATMIEEIDRGNSIISEFLYLAKDKKTDLQPGYLDDAVNALYPLIHADALHHGHTLQTNTIQTPCILIDSKEIRQVILNLTRNAMEAMDSPGIVTIRSYSTDEEVILEISDTGKGIPEEILAKIGTPFQTTKESGTGLGLAVCYGIANRHGAKLDCKTSSAGTTFTLRFKISK